MKSFVALPRELRDRIRIQFNSQTRPCWHRQQTVFVASEAVKKDCYCAAGLCLLADGWKPAGPWGHQWVTPEGKTVEDEDAVDHIKELILEGVPTEKHPWASVYEEVYRANDMADEVSEAFAAGLAVLERYTVDA